MAPSTRPDPDDWIAALRNDTTTLLALQDWEKTLARHNAVLRGGDHDDTTFTAFGPFIIEMGPASAMVSVYEPTNDYEDHEGRQLQVYRYAGQRLQP